MQIIRYTSDRQSEWDAFVKGSKNGTFLFLRPYMDYHSDRFIDHSLMYYNDKSQLIAVMPANERDNVLYSHQGLTYGGLVTSSDTTILSYMQIFELTISYLKENNITRWIYKQVPTIYHACPAQEDEYALWRHNAQLYSCLISTTVPLDSSQISPKMERRRKRGIMRAEKMGYHICESDDLTGFWPIMEQNLRQRYNVSPVHTVQEMTLLKQRFPENIKCYLVMYDEQVIAGAVLYICQNRVVHVQYGHSDATGKKNGALDLLYNFLIRLYRERGFKYLDFGNSNEQNGHYLNENLISQKEGFGGRGIVYKTYSIHVE